MRQAVVIAIVCLAVFFFLHPMHAKNVLYAPQSGPVFAPDTYGLPTAREVEVTTADGLSLKAWFAPPPAAGHGHVVMFMHGAGGNITQGIAVVRDLVARGYGVYVVGYRGYGGNPGTPTEAGIYEDARAGRHWLMKQGYAPASITLYGWSMGSAVALKLAVESRPAALVLMSPFTTLYDAAHVRYPRLTHAQFDASWQDIFDNLSLAGMLGDAPLLVIHGMDDFVLPPAQGRAVYAVAATPVKRLMLVKGAGHNDLFAKGIDAAIANWLDKTL